MYLGGLTHTSSRPGETTIYPGNAGQLRQVWKTSVGATVSSGVTVSGGSIYFGDWSGSLHSLNALTGAANGTVSGQGADPADAACQPGELASARSRPWLETRSMWRRRFAVYAMDRGTGAILWRFRSPTRRWERISGRLP